MIIVGKMFALSRKDSYNNTAEASDNYPTRRSNWDRSNERESS